MRRPRAAMIALAALIVGILPSVLFAPAALAADGDGLLGVNSDLQITLIAFGAIAFFAVLVIALSLIQGRLDARKARRRFDIERLG